MVVKKKFSSIGELQSLQELATKCTCDVGLHSEDGSVIIDAKSFIGLFALNFNEPILVVTESEDFLKKIQKIGQDL